MGGCRDFSAGLLLPLSLTKVLDAHAQMGFVETRRLQFEGLP
jgi:hypothetical protein